MNAEGGGTEACPHGFHHEEIFLAGKGNDFFGLAGVLGEGFFDEDGEVVFEAEAGVFGVKVVGGGDVYGVEFFLFEHGLVGGVYVGNTGYFLKMLGALGGARSGGDYGSFSGIEEVLGEAGGDESAADDAPAKFSMAHWIPLGLYSCVFLGR